jgi:glycosyltransferase involved in cell wall biosynthesis
MIQLSIIIPTLGRTREFKDLLHSIDETIPKDITYEILIIDQNFSDLLDSIVADFQHLSNVRHYKVSFRGLSKAKNFGISHSQGEILCFPDDDCRFLPNTIQKAIKILIENDFDMISGKTIDEKGNDSIVVYKKESALLTKTDFEGKFTEAAIFTYKLVIEKYLFDENLGVGTFWGCGEGWDLIMRMFEDNKRIYYVPDLLFYHPQGVVNKTGDAAIKRAFSYSCGFSAVCKKHKLYSKIVKRYLMLSIYLPLGVIINRKCFRYYFAQWLGLNCGVIIK